MESNTTTTRIPKLRVSHSTKIANDFEHTKRVIDNYISCSTFVDELVNRDIRDPRIFYDAYNNRLPDEYFNYVTNPLNSSKAEYTNWPSKIRSYSIIRPNIDLLEGEYEKRPFSFAVKVHYNDQVNTRQEAEYQAILQALQQQFINTLAQRGTNTGQPEQPVELPEKIKSKFQSNYKDQRALMGESALDIIIDQQHLEEKFKRLFRDWLIAGEVFSYKGIRGSNIVYERVSPLDISYDKSPDTEYIEDGQWVVRRIYMTPSDVSDLFYEELKEKDLDLMEDENGGLTLRAIGTGLQNSIRNDEDLRSSKVIVYHVVWKYLIKVGILTYINEFGQEEKIEVPEQFKPNKDLNESVEWFWVNEVWEGYRLTNDLYVGIRPVPSQRNTVNSLSECRLPYNGKRFSDTHSQNVSIVEMGLPYETLHRILHFNLEKTIAKSKGKIALIDQNVIPKKFGWDEEKFFYWAEATGFAMIDRSQPGVDKSYNQYSTLDLGLYQHISSLVELMQYVKSEWDELLGITRQRKGDSKASDSVRGNQMAISQSAVISEKVFSRFEEFVRSELQGLLDVSKLAWIDGFQAVHQGDDMRNAILQIDPSQYIESDYGVHISRSARDLQNLEMVRQQVQSFAQNGVSPSTIIDVVQARSLSKLRSLLQEAELKSMEAQQQMGLAEQEGAERIEMIKGSFEELKGIIDERLINVEYDRKEEIEHIKGAYSTYRNVEGTGDNNNDGVPDMLEVRKQFADEEDSRRKQNLDHAKTRIQERQKDRELDLKEKELTVRERIADKANATAIRNKTVGESKKPKK